MVGSTETSTLSVPPLPDAEDFVHQPLDLSHDEIRLVRILYQEQDKSVTLELKHFRTDQQPLPEYDALSYVWGPPEPKRSILVNRGRYLVRQNLFDFLAEAKRRKYDRWIFIDQVSIIQQNTVERNHQVTIMGNIFARAQNTISWLGCQHRRLAIMMSQCIAVARNRGPDYRQAWLDMHGVPYDRNQGQASLDCFRENAYWTRLWIIQEVRLSAHLVIWWGPFAFSPEQCLRVLKKLFFNPRDYFNSGDHHLKRMSTLLYPFTINPGDESLVRRNDRRLLDVIHWIEYSKCEDERDIIFGIQSLLRPGSRMKVDYSRILNDVYDEALSILFAEADMAGYDLAKTVVRQVHKLRVAMFKESHRVAHDEAEKLVTYLARRSSKLSDGDQIELGDPSKLFATRCADFACMIASYRKTADVS